MKIVSRVLVVAIVLVFVGVGFIYVSSRTLGVHHLKRVLLEPETNDIIMAWSKEILEKEKDKEFINYHQTTYPWLYPSYPLLSEIPPKPIADHQALYWGLTPETYIAVSKDNKPYGVILSWANMRIGALITPGMASPKPNSEMVYVLPVTDNINVFNANY